MQWGSNYKVVNEKKPYLPKILHTNYFSEIKLK